MLRCVFIAVLCLVPHSLRAEPTLARIFSDHAVLQRDEEIPVWGTGGKPGSDLVIQLASDQAKAKIDSEGNWIAILPSRKSDDKGLKLSLLENGIEVDAAEEILIGEVWLVAGQSNMQFQVNGMLKGMPETQSWVNSATHPEIRFRRINDPVLQDQIQEATDLKEDGEWVPMSPESVLSFSAVAAGFAKDLADELKVPVGILDVSWGGKPIEPFIPREAFDSPLLSAIKALADQEKLAELADLHGGVIIRNPEGYPGAIFNARIAPLIPYGLKGFLWYQGESNSGKKEDPREYRHKMEALIQGWRSRWENDTLPCYFVQLPSYPPATGWIRMREEQRLALKIPHTGMAVTMDIRGDDIHPPDKLPVGNRLARLALARSYGKSDIPSSGPLYRAHQIEGSSVRVSFDHTESGLMIGNRPGSGPVEETADAALKWFELADAEGNWHPAKATIEGDQVIVSSDSVKNPAAVRYACETKPQGGNLYNRAGLPASPFCSKLDWLPWEDSE